MRKNTGTDMHPIIEDLSKRLKESVDEKTLATSQHFFKETIRFYGVTVPTVNKISKEFSVALASLEKREILDLCEQLWKSGLLEESFVACNWSYDIRDRYERVDFEIFERWIDRYVNNWASCDTLCNHTVGAFIEKYPEYVQRLKAFSTSGNRWMRRAAAVSLIIQARKGLFHEHVFEIADSLLLDKDDLVQKGYGWVLKAASQSNQQAVFDFVMARKALMPRTALRYAIEKMPETMKRKAMEK
jgi:3-methyladenine DNA glycosylase AlkD